jgi:signal transduction histidine kinase
MVVELAHDLRSPLSSILFLSEVLRSGHSGPVTDHQWKQLGLVYSATLGMVSVVSDVMDLASEQKGSAIEDPSPFSIGAVFDSVHKMVGPMAEEKGISLEFRLPDYDRCLGTPGPLGRIMLNLTTNALKFTDEGWVRVAADKLGRSIVEFSVQDSGRGMAPDEIGRLFQPFRKSPYRSGYFFSGSGLGLSIAKRLLATMGSELKIESAPGEGSRFSFRVELPTVSAV